MQRVPSSRRIAGRPAPPSRDDVVTLGPGRTHRIDGWAWADGSLPWTTAAGDESWTVVRDGALTITLCLTLRDHRAAFAAAGVPVAAAVAFTTGRLCARPATVRYRTVSHD